MLTAMRQTVTHIRESRRFELIYILQGKPDTHDTYVLITSHIRQLFMLTQQIWRDALLSRKGLLPRSTAQLTDPQVPPIFSPITIIEALHLCQGRMLLLLARRYCQN
jgi:hypothetical protein